MKSAQPFSTPPSVNGPTFPASYQRNAQRIALPYLNRTVMVSLDDIMTLEGDGNYTYLCTRDRKKYLLARTLKNFEATFNADQFVRIHKSYMVNLAYVRSVVTEKNCTLKLADGSQISVSRRRQKDIIQQLNRYQQRLMN